ncbi:MAG: SulP family inorganic anion transporter [Gemmatimonadales bacterium]|nr:SulP family inorganic anion transporter [Gemmatimonadales bacterium]
MIAWPRLSDDELRADLGASVVVFLVALPLCLGIALASGAPLVAGLVAGVIGGLVVAPLSGSALMVSGPAAGLTAVVLASIEQLGGFDAFLAALVVAGAIQLGFGLLRLGFISAFFPSSVIKGMLAAIGLLLVLKQLPHAVGYDHDAMGSETFSQGAAENTLTALRHMLARFEGGAMLVSLVSLALLAWFERPALRLSRVRRVLPPPLVAVLAGIGLNELLRRVAPGIALGPDHLVQLPGDGSLGSLARELAHPRWAALGTFTTWRVGLTVAVVASLETLLSLEATDKLDPLRRHAPPDRELLAQGAGNLLSGLLGGLPLTGVIVRSAANVEAGGRTRRSAIAHGVLLVLALALIPGVLNRIPLSALAAVLLHVGWKLAHPLHLVKAWQIGREQFIPFVITIAAILLTDLLTGVLLGLGVGIFWVLREHATAPGLTPVSPPGAVLTRYTLGQQATFLSRVRIQNTLAAIEPHARVEIDGRGCRRIDPDVLALLHEFRGDAERKGIDYRLVGIPPLPAGLDGGH